MKDQNEQDTYPDTDVDINDTSVSRFTIRGQKEKEKEKQKQQQKAFNPNIENNPDIEDQQQNKTTNDVKEIVEFWDNNEFDFSNVNAKQQLLSWINDSSLLQAKDVFLKAMTIACANNKRKLNYMGGNLKKWGNDLYSPLKKMTLIKRTKILTQSIGNQLNRFQLKERSK